MNVDRLERAAWGVGMELQQRFAPHPSPVMPVAHWVQDSLTGLHLPQQPSAGASPITIVQRLHPADLSALG